MFEFIIFSVMATLSLALNIFIIYNMWIPLLIGFPYGLILFFRGKIRFFGVVSQIISFILWFLILFTIGFIAGKFFPNKIKYFINNPAINFGGLLAIFWSIIGLFSATFRQELKENFEKFAKTAPRS